MPTPTDLYTPVREIEFRFAPPTLVWCRWCRAAHEPNTHHDGPRCPEDRAYLHWRGLQAFMAANRGF